MAACSTLTVPVQLRRRPPAAAELLRSHPKIETVGLLLFEQNPVTLSMRDFASSVGGEPVQLQHTVRLRTLLSLALGVSAFVFVLAWGFAEQDSADLNSPQVLALVEGNAITDQDLLPQIRPQLQQLRNQEYEMKSRALESLIDQKLIEAEADRRGIGVGELLRQEVDAKAAEPGEAEIEAFFLGQKDFLNNRPLAEVKDQLAQVLRQARQQQARQGLYQRLRQNAHVSILLRPPKVEVAFDPTRVRGNPDAPVTIVEFSDFQCPFCQRAYPVIKALLSKYDGQVKLSYRDFPLYQAHPQAQTAAEAARCAGEQGKYWEYHDRLFENFNQLSEETLAEHAAGLGLDSREFQACLQSGRHRAAIERDVQDGTEAGITGTPAFFINGVLVSGALPASVFEQAIEAELSAINQAGSPLP